MGNAGSWMYGVVMAAGFGAAYAVDERMVRAIFVAATLFWILVAPIWLARGVRSEHRIGLAAGGFLVLVPAALALVVLRPQNVIEVLLLVWIADTAAYFVGRAWGRRKLAPSISPGKTWEGAWGGIAAAIAYAMIGGTFLLGTAGWLSLFLVGVALAVISIVGDLFESAAKRQAGVKDSGALLPGHGGILDRVDSAAAVLPVAALLLSLPNP